MLPAEVLAKVAALEAQQGAAAADYEQDLDENQRAAASQWGRRSFW